MNKMASHIRGHSTKLKKIRWLNNIKDYSFPLQSMTVWNGLEEETEAKNLMKLEKTTDKYRYSGRTT